MKGLGIVELVLFALVLLVGPCAGFTPRAPHQSIGFPAHNQVVVVQVSGSRSPQLLWANDNDNNENDDEDDMFSMDAFQKAKDQVDSSKQQAATAEEVEAFDGYQFRDALVEKWGESYDVDFNRVEAFGFRNLYLNVLPFYWGRPPFRHESELDYLCHLQAVVEILQQYNQLEYVLAQIQETKKIPKRAGKKPVAAVPLRLDLTPEEIKQIMNY